MLNVGESDFENLDRNRIGFAFVKPIRDVSNMEEPILKVENLSHRYSVQWAIKDIDFVLSQRGIYALLGSNGAGKSTTMNIICGIIKPTTGKVFVNGIDSTKDSLEAKRQIGFLPQSAPLYKDLTVEEYLSYCASIHYVPEKDIQSAVDEVLEKCGISHFRKRLIRNLSGGYKQRVGIAQAIIHHPTLVILDEPTNGLDPNQVLEVRHLLRSIAADATVILSTHILSEVVAISDYILMIEKGQLVFNGSVNDFHTSFEPNTLMITFTSDIHSEDLSCLSGVERVEMIDKRKYRLYFQDLQEVINPLLRNNINHGWGLAEMWPEEASLESVFNELSGNLKK